MARIIDVDPADVAKMTARLDEAERAASPDYGQKGNPPFTPAEEQALPGMTHLTDVGNAARFVRQHGRDVRYCYPWKKWLAWDGRRWAIDEGGEIEKRAQATAANIYHEAAVEIEPEAAKSLAKHAMRSQNVFRLKAMVELARPDLAVHPADLDTDPWLLNIRTGALDLRTGVLLPHDRSHLLTKLAPVDFDLVADCPTWTAFLDRIFNSDLDLIGFIQRAVGYSLTGDVREQCFFLCYGTGANGKSTFLEVVRTIMGDYAQQAEFSTFLTSKFDNGPTNDLAALKGARFVAASEGGVGRALNEALIKHLTGGEQVRARFLYGEFFEFLPEFKLWLASNHKPRVRDQSSGLWRRVRLIPFEITIPKGEQDKDLSAKLLAESAGILKWAVEGCLAWQREGGLGESEKISRATADYQISQDPLAGFLDDDCLLCRGVQIESPRLRKAYQDWCGRNDETELDPKIFKGSLESRGCHQGKSNGDRVWKGIILKECFPGGTGGTGGTRFP